MGLHYQDRGYGQLAELNDDFTIEAVSLEECSSLGLEEKTCQPEASPVANPFQLHHKTNELLDDSEEDSKNYSDDPEPEACSSLNLYFKTINKFRLLSKEEEIRLVKCIKEHELDCKNLVIEWKHLVSDELQGMLICRKEKIATTRSRNLMFLFSPLMIL